MKYKIFFDLKANERRKDSLLSGVALREVEGVQIDGGKWAISMKIAAFVANVYSTVKAISLFSNKP